MSVTPAEEEAAHKRSSFPYQDGRQIEAWHSGGHPRVLAATTYFPALTSWREWSQIFTDVTIWRPVVERICRDTATAPALLLEPGYPGTCAVFVVDWQVVVKIYPPFLSSDFGRESEAYRLLARHPVPLPKLLAQGIYHDRNEWPYIVLEFRPGQPIRDVRQAVSPENKLALACELGRIIRAMHTAPLEKSHYLDPRPEIWRAFVEKRKGECVEELRSLPPPVRSERFLPERMLRQIPVLFEAVEALAPPDFKPCLLNGDLTEDHLLLVNRAGQWKISALIDFGDARVGAAEYEWVALWFGLCGRNPVMFLETLRAYDPELELDEVFRRRMMAYTLIHEFGAGMIKDVLKQTDAPQIQTLDDLQSILWPSL